MRGACRSRSRRWTVAGAAVLLIPLLATVLAACGSSAAKSYTDSEYGYSFSYPGTWRLQSSVTSDAVAGGAAAETVAAYNPDGTVVDQIYVDLAMVMVYRLNSTVGDPWAAHIKAEVTGLVTQLQSQATNMKIEKPLAQTARAGLKGYVVTVTFTKGGAPIRSTLYFLFKGTTEYQLTLQAAAARWDTTERALDDVIDSFRLESE